MRVLRITMIGLATAAGTAAQVPVNDDSHPSVSPAGDRVAFESRRGGASDLYWMRVGGGWPHRITSDVGANRNVTWAPSGDVIAFESDRGGTWQIYTRTLDDSGATRVTDVPNGAHDPAFFPDGQRLVFTSSVDSVSQLFRVDPGTGVVTQLTRSPGNKTEPAYSHAGDRLAFLSDATGGLEIVVAAADGSREHRITSFTAEDERRFVNGLGWTPQGRLIFAANRHVHGRYFFSTDIYTLRPDGTDLEGLARSIAGRNNPSMAWDGSLIAFDSFACGGLDVFIVQPDGTDVRNLTATSENNFFASPTPDGERVVFQSEREGQRDLYIMRRDGTGVRNLTRNPEDDRAPSISRDGHTVAFASFRENSWGGIYTMDLNGDHVTRVTPSDFFRGLDQFPIATAITPDGRTILFESAPVIVEGEAHWDIWRIGVDGRGAERLTHTSGSARSSAPDVSPDGRSVVYFSNETGDYEVYRMPVDGGRPVQLTSGPSADYYPTWSPDGTAIYFTSNRDGQPDVYRMESDGSDVQRITFGTPEAYHLLGRLDEAGRNLWVHGNGGGGLHIHRMEPDGTGEVRLTGPWGPTPDDRPLSAACTGFTRLGQPHWSWARNEIAFPGDCDGGERAIYIYSVEGDSLGRLPLAAEAPDSPAWSYAGDRLAFNATDEAGDRDLYIYELGSGRTTRVTRGGAWGGWVTWSPDDLWLNGYGRNEHGTWDIFRIRTDGSERLRLNGSRDGDYYTPAEAPGGGEFLYSMGNRLWRMSDESSAEPVATGRLAAVMPRWAPGGRRYVFDGFDGSAWNLYVGDWRLGEPIRLTRSVERASNGTWGPDGRRIVYICRVGGIDSLCIVDVDTRRSRPLFLPHP